MVSRSLEILFVLLLVVGVPVLSYVTVRRTQIRLIPRLALYFSAVISQWVLAVVGVVVVVATGRGFAGVGFRPVSGVAFFRWTFLVTSVALVALGLWLLLERWGWWPAESELVRLLVPETRAEKLWAVLLLAPTAACCEEFLYRGYLLAQLAEWLRSDAGSLAVTSVAFGLAHVYQGLGGMTRATVLGALLAYPVFRLRTLYPSMGAHFLIDALALAWLGPAFLRQGESPSREAAAEDAGQGPGTDANVP